ncbi:hypothetical protein FRC12_000518 [Ceratobasidium sp. 428]|nr:hypothetical protein FRC12_000518 [Ceratobasidium sp. 428]
MYHETRCPTGVIRGGELDFSGVLFDAPAKLQELAGSVLTASPIPWLVKAKRDGQDSNESKFKFRALSKDPPKYRLNEAIGELLTHVSSCNPQPQTEPSKFLFKFGFKSTSKPAHKPPSSWTVHLPEPVELPEPEELPEPVERPRPVEKGRKVSMHTRGIDYIHDADPQRSSPRGTPTPPGGLVRGMVAKIESRGQKAAGPEKKPSWRI